MHKIHVEVFIASQVLEQQQGIFTSADLKHFIKHEFDDERPGIATHISAHCVANAPLNTAHGYNYLWRLSDSKMRTFRSGCDTPIMERLALSSEPEIADLPTNFQYLLRSQKTEPDPVAYPSSEKIKVANGHKFTVPAARYLIERCHGSSWQVFYDHGGDSSQRIYSWFGQVYTAPKADKHLAWIDIVVAEPTSGKVYQIMEIEDSIVQPKTIMGDLMAVLLGDGLATAGRSDWQVGSWTTLTVFSYVKTSTAEARFHARLAHLQGQIANLRTSMGTRNAAIGHIVLDTFKDHEELVRKLGG